MFTPIFPDTCAWAILLSLIAHTITHIAHTLPLSAEWSCSVICKKLFDSVTRSCFNCSIDNANMPGDNMTRLFNVYFRGTSNIAAERIAAPSARVAVQLAATLANCSPVYLIARIAR
jgi:hypothetical protein